MVEVFTTEIVEAIVFGVMWVVLILITVFWMKRSRADRRIMRWIWFLLSLGAMFITIAAIALLLKNGCNNCGGKKNSEGEWGRFIGYTLAFTAVYVAIAVYHALETIPTIIGTITILVSWIPTIFTVLNNRSGEDEKDAQIFWGVLGGVLLVAASVMLCIFSRLRKKIWDWLPIFSYFIFSILIWVFLWLGPDSARRIGDTATVAIYVSLAFLLILVTGITLVWGFGFRNSRASAVKASERRYPANQPLRTGQPPRGQRGNYHQ